MTRIVTSAGTWPIRIDCEKRRREVLPFRQAQKVANVFKPIILQGGTHLDGRLRQGRHDKVRDAIVLQKAAIISIGLWGKTTPPSPWWRELEPPQFLARMGTDPPYRAVSRDPLDRLVKIVLDEKI